MREERPLDDMRDLDARAVRWSIALVEQSSASDLGRPTPCGSWTLRELLAHMAVQHHGFARAADGIVTEVHEWQPVALADPQRDYVAAANGVLVTFADDNVLERRWTLPELSTETAFSSRRAVSFHFIDYVVHSWDVAKALGVPFEPEHDLLDAALTVARAVPDGPSRLAPGAAFAPGVPAPDDASVLDRIVAVLGRDPAWMPPMLGAG
jgi:uncharacterized protein (TIGR03086 family)